MTKLKHLVTYFLFLLFSFLWAQNNAFVIQNAVTFDTITNAKVLVNQQKIQPQQGVYRYDFSNELILTIQHPNFHFFKEVYQDTLPKSIRIEPTVLQLGEVKIKEEKIDKPLQVSVVTQADKIQRNGGKDLAHTLQHIAGIATNQTGGNISKPIIHGMSGNRILVLNNGLNIESQQWGDEHAIEVDPLLAEEIAVIKGAILIKPKDLFRYKRNFEANVLVGYETNAKAYTTSLNLGGKINRNFFYALQGSYQNVGDYHSAEYVVNNTGHRKTNAALQLGYQNQKNKVALYANYLEQ